MFTYKFFIAKNGKLALRLRNNNKKTEINLHHVMTPDELVITLAQIVGKRGTSRLKSQVSFYIAVMNRIADQLISECRMDEDIMVIRHMIEVGFGIAKFEDINLQWLTDFENFCARTAGKNARNIHLRNIRAVFNNAIDYEITTAYPFRRFKIRPEATRKRSLSVEELRKLFTCPTEPYAEIYRDMFKLIFMLIGINGVDLHGLKSITKDGRIEYRRAKTHKLYSIKVEPEAMEIIEKYKGNTGLLCIADRWSDYRNFRHQCNNALHLIGAERNKGGRLKGGAPKKTDKNNKPKGLFPDLTMYAARHSWATIAAELDVPGAVISQALGHSGSNSTTEIYIKRNQKKVDDANRRVLDWVLYGKR